MNRAITFIQRLIPKWSLTLLFVWGQVWVGLGQPLHRYEYSRPQMGTTFRIILYAEHQTRADQAAQAAFKCMEALNARLSDYIPDSELNRLSASAGTDQWVVVSDVLWDILKLSHQISEQSQGAFDSTIGPLSRLWRRAISRQVWPDESRLRRAAERVDYRFIMFDSSRHAVRLSKPGMQLDLGGIAKGYAVDQALSVLTREGIRSALVDGGGDIGMTDPPPGTLGWSIAVATVNGDGRLRSEQIVLHNQAIATSGDLYKFIVRNGRRYSHIVNPQTGLGTDGPALVTVIARNTTLADAWASALSVTGKEDGLKLIDLNQPEMKVRIIESDTSRAYRHQTIGFPTGTSADPTDAQ